jgi:hypothetical protein
MTMTRQQALDELTQLWQDMGDYDVPKLHLVNHVTGWTGDDGLLVMLWRVVDDAGKPLSKWTTHKAAESYKEKLKTISPILLKAQQLEKVKQEIKIDRPVFSNNLRNDIFDRLHSKKFLDYL